MVNKNRKKISCIIPAFNEEDRIENNLQIAINHPLIDEVIVINDGSNDRTGDVLKRFKGIKIVNNPLNMGKSFSVMKGLELVRNEIILLLDADLEGLTKENLDSLINPVLKNDAKITISERKNSLILRKIMGVDYLSGDRVFDRKIIRDYKELSKIKGYGLEVFLNEIIIKDKLPLEVVKWDNVRAPDKREKSKSFQAIKQNFRMLNHMLNTVGIRGVLNQMYKLRQLRIHKKNTYPEKIR